MLLDHLKRRRAHTVLASIIATQKTQRAIKRSRLAVECGINQRVVIEINFAAQIKVAVEPVGAARIESAVDAGVIVKVDLAVEIGVAVVRVLHERIPGGIALTGEDS